jgi:NADH-ubiquinone oxidoreductase chain 6
MVSNFTNTLYVLSFTYAQEYVVEYLDVFSLLAIVCAILTIINKNPIVSVLFLICLFVLISGYLILIGLNFIGISYLLVYVGAVSILFLFILMLINIRISEIQSNTSNSLPLAILISMIFYSTLNEITSEGFFNKEWLKSLFSSSKENINIVSTTSWDSNLVEVIHITSIGNILYTNYFLWLILASTILLLAMVGAIVITIK